MQRALDLAIRGAGAVSPNPLVGAVIVAGEQVIGEGWHQEYGGPHAEVNAIRSVKDDALLAGSTVYVTLEPCSHFGKTPPCADLLVEKKVGRVVIGVQDPNPKVAGAGIERLKNASIEVKTGILGESCIEINRRFFCATLTHRPYLILKWAQTRDGFTARADFSSKWISGESARALVHKWRSEEDAILVGPDTALHDNPSLTVRDWPGRNPLRVVLDRSGRLPVDLRVFSDGHPTLYYSRLPDAGVRNCTHIQISGEVFIREVLADLYRRGVQSVFVEGGSGIHKMLITENLWDETRVFESEVLFGEGVKAPCIPPGRTRRMHYDQDELIITRNTLPWQKHYS